MWKDYYEGKWYEVDDEWMKGIEDINGVREIYAAGQDKIRVIYNNGKEIYYQNAHGSWGFPTIFK